MASRREASEDARPLSEAIVVPIHSLNPNSPLPVDAAIDAVVTLVWPYASSTRTTALLLADPDFRLRRSNGQIRVRLQESAAEAVTNSSISIGDRVRLNLAGAVWAEQDTTISTPGKSVQGELLYKSRIFLQRIRSTQSPVLVNVTESDLDRSPCLPLIPQQVEFTALHAPLRPVNLATAKLPFGVWASPAFLRPSVGASRNTAVLFSDESIDEENLVDGPPVKRTRLSWTSHPWRLEGFMTTEELPQTIEQPEVIGDIITPVDATHSLLKGFTPGHSALAEPNEPSLISKEPLLADQESRISESNEASQEEARIIPSVLESQKITITTIKTQEQAPAVIPPNLLSTDTSEAICNVEPLTPDASQQASSAGIVDLPLLHRPDRVQDTIPLTPLPTQSSKALEEMVDEKAQTLEPQADAQQIQSQSQRTNLERSARETLQDDEADAPILRVSDLTVTDPFTDQSYNGFRTSLSYYTPLNRLEHYINQSSHVESKIDVMAIISSFSSKPTKAEKPPKDFFTITHILDPSSLANPVQVEIFRPRKRALPAADIGDVVLLRNFEFKSRKPRHRFLLSGDSSAWVVWRCRDSTEKMSFDDIDQVKDGDISKLLDHANEEVAGPPVELRAEERNRAASLRAWWLSLKRSDDEVNGHAASKLW